MSIIDPDMNIIDPDALRTMQERGGDWYAYRNADLSSPNVGHLQFLQCGPGRTYETPPERMPDTSVGLGWRYTLVGPVPGLGGAE